MHEIKPQYLLNESSVVVKQNNTWVGYSQDYHISLVDGWIGILLVLKYALLKSKFTFHHDIE